MLAGRISVTRPSELEKGAVGQQERQGWNPGRWLPIQPNSLFPDGRGMYPAWHLSPVWESQALLN